MIGAVPIYDYRCDHCGHVFSAVQTFTDAAIGACPSCGKTPRRLLTAPAILFKGSGWYKTDSRAAPKDETKVATKTETKSDAAPAAGSDASPAVKPTPAKGEAAS